MWSQKIRNHKILGVQHLKAYMKKDLMQRFFNFMSATHKIILTDLN